MSEEQTTKHPCPTCGKKIDWDLDCPGYGREGKIMVCWPPSSCGNAIRYFCTCGWWFRDPNKRDTEGMGIEPWWINDARKMFEPNEDDND